MKYTKLIFLTQFPFVFDHYQRFDLDSFKKKGLKIFIIDLSKFHINSTFRKDPKLKKFNLIIIKNYSNWKKIISKFDPEDTIIWKQFFVSNLNFLRVNFDLNVFNSFRVQEPPSIFSYKKKDWLFSKKYSLKEKINSIYYFRWVHFFLYTVKILSFICNTKNEKIIKINTCNYNRILTFRKEKKKIKQKYCVFIASAHPVTYDDADHFQYPKSFSKKNWLKRLNFLFDFIEKELLIKVIIHPHPKSIKGKKKFYGNRQEIRNNLVELIKYSQFVIHSISTSFEVALFFNKPTISILSNEVINASHLIYKRSYDFFEKKTGVQSVNIDKPFKKEEFIRLFRIDKKKYNLLKKKLYIKKNILNSDIIYNYLSKKIF